MEMQKSGRALLEWHGQTERDLPWRGETEAYRIWISETMLQQTRVAVVAGRYVEFLRAFPDVWALARAEEQQVLGLWQGLGYYARARNLHRAAKQVCSEHGGRFPQEEAALRSLAGVGEYTACAVLSMAYGQPEAAIDANLARVISRVWELKGYVEENWAELRQLGNAWLRSCAMDCPGDFNRALMGLGAMVCTARRPDCANCPIALWCEAYAQGEQEILPEKRPKSARREEWHALGLCVCGERILVRQRPEKGMLAGMWEFPHYRMDEEETSVGNLEKALREDGFGVLSAGTEAGRSEFVFSHRVWRIRAWHFRAAQQTAAPWRWVNREELAGLPMASVMEPYRQRAMEILGKSE